MTQTKTIVEERGTAIDAMVIERRYVLSAKGDMKISIPVDATADREVLDELMDTMSHIGDREVLKAERAEKAKALEVARSQPLQMRREIDRIRLQRATYIASAKAMWVNAGRRAEYKETPKHKSDMEKFEVEIANCEQNIANFRRDIPIIEWELACFDARIAGKELPEPPPEAEAALEELRSGMAA